MNNFSELPKKFFMRVANCSQAGVVQALRPASLIAALDAHGRQRLPVVNHALVMVHADAVF